MIIGPGFVWLHFPKTGGHTVAAALRAAVPGQSAARFDPVDDDGWHDTFEDRRRRDAGFDPSGRTVVSGMRRLPWWLLSRVHYEAARPPHRCASREMICRGEFYEQNGRTNLADAYARKFADNPVDRWVRLEHLADDFVAQFEDLLGPRVRQATRKLRKAVNATRLEYVKSLGFYFTAEELAGLYAANPVWARIERDLYGDILRL